MLPDSIFSVFVQSLGTGEVLVSLLGIVAAAAFAGLFAYNALTVGIGEAAVCFLLGVPLLRALEKRAIA